MSSFFTTQVGEVFQSVEDNTLCEEDSCDSANCSHCEDIMDRSFKLDKVDTQMRASWKVILQQDQGLNKSSCMSGCSSGWCDALLPSEINSEASYDKLEENFVLKCHIRHENHGVGGKQCCMNVESSDTNLGSNESTQSSDETIAAVDEKSSSSCTQDRDSSNVSCNSHSEIRYTGCKPH